MLQDGLTQIGNLSMMLIFDGQKKKNTNEVDYSKYIDLVDYARSKGFSVELTAEYAPCLAHLKNSFAVDEKLNTYSCPGLLYEKISGMIGKNGTHIVTDNQWYEHRVFERECVKKCKYAPICYGGCKMTAKCRKEEIEAILYYQIDNKIQSYKEMVGA